VKGTDHGQDIQKALKVPERQQDDLGRLASPPPSASRRDTLERATALVGRTWTRSSWTRRTAMRRAARRGGRSAVPLSGRGPDRRQRGDGRATEALIRAGDDAVKVGIGAGSICTTRLVAGIGVAMITRDCELLARGGDRMTCRSSPTEGFATRATSRGVAVGGGGAMIGSLFAGNDESRGEVILYQGRSFKEYRGMGSIGAMRRGSATLLSDEYEVSVRPTGREARAEGIEGRVPYKGAWRPSSTSWLAGCGPGWATAVRGALAPASQCHPHPGHPGGRPQSHVHDV